MSVLDTNYIIHYSLLIINFLHKNAESVYVLCRISVGLHDI